MLRQLFVLPLLFGVCWAAPADVDPESIEPPLGYSLQVGNESISLREGQPVQLTGTFVNPQVKLSSGDFRTFPYAGLSFRYPKEYSFEAKFTTAGLRQWTLDGRNCVVCVQVFKANLTLSELVNSLTDQFGKQNCQVTDVSITLGDHKFKGKRIQAKVVMQTVIQEVFPLPSSAGAKFLALQDLPNNDGTPSDERKRLGKLLTETFAITKPKQQ